MRKKFMIIIITISLQMLGQNDLSYTWPDFNTSMKSPAQTYQETFFYQDPFWNQLAALYDQNIISNLEFSEEPRIPKIIHQIWVGSPLPEKYKALQETWKKNHPDWQYILWTDKELNALDFINKDKYNAATNMGEKSDIARYELLYRYGGIYIDTDFECLLPFDILHHTCDFYAGLDSSKEVNIFNGLIAGKAGHPILKKCVESLRLITQNSTSIYEIIEKTGPRFFTRCIKESLSSITGRSVIFPSTYFYPWPGGARAQNSRTEIEQWFKPESFAVHHWHCSWQK